VLHDVVGEGDVGEYVGVALVPLAWGKMSRQVVVRNGHLECVQCIPIFLVQWPSDVAVQLFHGRLGLFCHVPHDRRYHLALIVPLLALDDIFGGYSTFR
jgi:hypothetical protein